MRRLISATVAAVALAAPPASSALKVNWMAGFRAPGTPARYDKVGVLKIGPRGARNVLVLEPGTSAGSAYFVPLARWIVATVPGWQVWSIERRENLLEDQSMLRLAKARKASAKQLFDYYLGYITDPSIRRHFVALRNASVQFAKTWGLKVVVEDLHRVIAAARKLGGRVVLGGHSLGGSVVTAYATWNFHGKPGADQLGGLVYDDGASRPAVSADTATSELQTLSSAPSPWLPFGGIPAPLAGILSATGSTAALLYPNQRSLGQESGLLNLKFPDGRALTPSVPVTNLGQYGFALNVATSPSALAAAQAHLGRGIAAKGPVHGWNRTGALTPIDRFATMFSGTGLTSTDGTEWYFPERLTDDTTAIGNGIRNPAQAVLGVESTLGRKLPKHLRIYAFAAALGSTRVLDQTRALARQSGIPIGHLTLIDRHTTYAHNDPAGAYPHNVFFSHLVTFLRNIATPG